MTERSSLSPVLDELRAFVTEREWERFHNVKNLAMLLASETGELVALLRWVDSDRADSEASGELRDRFAAELGDVGIAWLLLCDRIGLDPIDCVTRKLARNRENYPAVASRGRSERP